MDHCPHNRTSDNLKSKGMDLKGKNLGDKAVHFLSGTSRMEGQIKDN